MGEDLVERARQLHDDVICGDFRTVGDRLKQLRADKSAVARAWVFAIEAARELVDPEAASAPGRVEIAKLQGEAPLVREAAALACAHRERAAFVSWDVEQLRAWRDLHATLAEGVPAAERWLRRADAWLKLVAGEVEVLNEEGKTLYVFGAAAQDASLVIDATLLRSLAALTSGDLDESTALARRASRMARTEGLRAERFLASILLARVRRKAGRPHLATRILAATAPLAPGIWQGWIRWERLFAGRRAGTWTRSEDTARVAALTGAWPDGPATRASRLLVEWLHAASKGLREMFDEKRDALAQEVSVFAEILREQQELAAALDPAADPIGVPEDIRAWASGVEDETPSGLHGIVGPPDGPADSTVASVVVSPGMPPRRVLRVATPLLAERGEIIRLERTRLRRGRVDTACAALALAGEDGLIDSDLFEKAYEFEFVPSLHAGILDVLVHRMRARLEGAATVHRKDGRLRLEPHGNLVLPDPRCVEHVEERLLRVIARHGGVTTRQAADELDVSVRTAQLALRRLLASGDCVLNRDGRRVQYLVEDTTFSEPTRF